VINRSRLAAYLDEAGDDPATACLTLAGHGVKYACLRRAWTGPVAELSDQALSKLRDLLSQHAIQPVSLAVPPAGDPERAALVAAYFGVQFLHLRPGSEQELRLGQELAVRDNLTPLLELRPGSPWLEPAAAVEALTAYPRWRLLYDPAELLPGCPDPFVRYWTLLKSKVGVIDLHDLRVGQGFCPVGHGDGAWARTLSDAAQAGFSGWYFLEPGLGRRYGSALQRQDTFGLAIQGLETLARGT